LLTPCSDGGGKIQQHRRSPALQAMVSIHWAEVYVQEQIRTRLTLMCCNKCSEAFKGFSIGFGP
jgi:hypothetical protein